MLNKFFRSKLFFQTAIASIVAVFATIGIVAATTTIGSNISSTGTLAVTSTTATSTFSTGGLAIGTNQFVVQQTSGYVGIGTTSPRAKLEVSGDIVVNGLTVGQGASITAPSSNTILGLAALGTGNASSNAAYSVAVGYHALFSVGSTYAGNEVAIGYNALGALTGVGGSSNSNIAIGRDSLGQAIYGGSNTAIGSGAIGGVLTGGGENTAVGYVALAAASGTSAQNTAVGRSALRSLSGGNNNTALGYQALGSNAIGSNNVALGYDAGTYELGSSTLYIDNQNRGSTAGDKAGALLYGTFNSTPSLQTLTINGKVGIGTTTPLANLQVTTSTANATTSVQFGKANQNKGTCLTLYDTAGNPVYAYIATGAAAFTLQNGGTAPSGCQN